jgi:hypothetical protein
VKPFTLIDSQVGAIFMINGRVAGLDAFGKPGTFAEIFKKLLESYALDAIDWHDPDKEYKALKSEVTKFRKAALSAGAEGRPSVGLGVDFRLESGKVTGFALAFDDQVIHVSIFSRTDGQDRNTADSRIERFSSRRRNRSA